MSAIVQAQRNKNADLRRRSPTGHHDARTNQQAVHQTSSIVTFRSGHPPPNSETQPIQPHKSSRASRQAPLAPTAVALKSP